MTIISNRDGRVGSAVAAARRAAGWSREQLAPAMGLSALHLAEAEAGQLRLQTADLFGASAALKTSAAPFLAIITGGDPGHLRAEGKPRSVAPPAFTGTGTTGKRQVEPVDGRAAAASLG